MKRLIIRIIGSVQGVGFRWAAQKAAKKYGVVGFVQNMTDGSVYIEAQADAVDLEQFLKWCRKGPLFSRVDKVEFEEAAAKGYNEFEIRQ